MLFSYDPVHCICAHFKKLGHGSIMQSMDDCDREAKELDTYLVLPPVSCSPSRNTLLVVIG